MKFRNLLGYVVGSAIFLVFFLYLIRLISQKFAFIIFENQILPIVFGAPFLALGAIYIILSNIQMKRIGKGNPADGFNVAIGERTKNLMTEGIYKHTRNPMLFGVFTLYIGISLLTNSYAALVFPAIFIAYMSWHVKKFEEPRLLLDFGDEYERYLRKTPMIVPFLI